MKGTELSLTDMATKTKYQKNSLDSNWIQAEIMAHSYIQTHSIQATHLNIINKRRKTPSPFLWI